MSEELAVRDAVGRSERSFRVALDRLRAAQKPGAGAPPYSRWVNRRLGRVLAAAAYRVGATPNGVTALSALFTFSALALVALVAPTPWLGIGVTLLLVIGYALDAADGQLARLLGGGSSSGEWLDHMVDVTKTCVLHAAVLVSFYRFGGLPSPAFLLVPLGYLTVSIVLFFGIMLVEQLRRRAGRRGDRPVSNSRLQTLVALPVDYGVLCLIFLVFGWRPAFLVVYGLLFLAHTLVLGAVLVKWWRELRELDHAAQDDIRESA
jgi:phosphatidylglycerophosphate synthase